MLENIELFPHNEQEAKKEISDLIKQGKKPLIWLGDRIRSEDLTQPGYLAILHNLLYIDTTPLRTIIQYQPTHKDFIADNYSLLAYQLLSSPQANKLLDDELSMFVLSRNDPFTTNYMMRIPKVHYPLETKINIQKGKVELTHNPLILTTTDALTIMQGELYTRRIQEFSYVLREKNKEF